MAQNNKITAKYSTTPVFRQVVSYCILPELIITLIPFALVLLSLALQAVKADYAAEILSYYVAFPLCLAAPLLITLKQVSTLRKSFPRNTPDAHRVILSVFFSSALCIIFEIMLFILSCYLYSIFPMKFLWAAYIRDMFSSSVGAMIITFSAVFFAYALISLMSTTAFFMGEASKKKFSFSLSCLIFLVMYVILLLIFVFAYFGATFLDIKALENLQIANSIFNSSMLCSFVTFILISVIAMPVIYKLNFNALKKLTPPKSKK